MSKEHMRSRLISGTADILAGLAAFVLFVVADSFLHVAADLREAVIVLSLMYLAVGLLRGTGPPDSAWLKGLLVASGGTLVMLVLLWSQILHAFLAILLLAANLFTVWGVRARRLWPHQSALKWGIILLAPVTMLVLVVFTTVPTVATRVATRRITVPAPIFSMTASGGGQINSAGLHGRVVVLSFWATWCPACRRELPELDQLYRRYRSNSSVSFWGVDILGNGETAERAKDFLQKAGYALPLAFGNEKSAEDLGGNGLPFLIIMDKFGRVRLVHNGYDRSEPLQSELSKVIEALLNEA
jgi:thiol-disulfide isomerase/thioredoxin